MNRSGSRKSTSAASCLLRSGSGSVLVTTEGLLRLWLQEHKNWWKNDPLATDPKTALQSSAFYTQAISADAAVTIFAPLPIRERT